MGARIAAQAVGVDQSTAPGAWTNARRRRRRRLGWRAYLFLLPSTIILGVFVFYPIVESAWMSLHNWSFLAPGRQYVGLGNYRELLHDPRFWNALRNTVIFTAAVVPAQLILGLALANGLVRNNLLNRIFRSIFFFPVIGSLATMAIVWKFLLDPDIGLLSRIFTDLGFPQTGVLQSTTYALPALIVVSVWKNVGFTMVILLAALQGVPEMTYEAAAIDGAGPWARFRYVTLPSLRQALLFSSVISVIASLQLFDQVYVMTGGGPLFHTETLVTYMYKVGFQDYRSGYAAALAWVLFLLIMAVSVVQLRFFRYRDVD
jgi:multiple sugar transport system permease protein/raffinose/stachyose/melibiose transport system permease protein